MTQSRVNGGAPAAYPESSETMQYRWDDFVLDLDAYRLERAGVPVPLEPKALNLLALVVRRPGHVFTKQELFETLWSNTAVTDHALTRVVSQIRRGLGDEAREARYLETVPTRGYRWIRPVSGPDHAGGSAVSAAAGPVVASAGPVAVSAGPVAVGHAPQVGAPAAPAPAPARAAAWQRPALAASVALAAAMAALGVWTLGDQAADGRVGAVAWAASSKYAASPDTAWPVQHTTHPGVDLHPALSPRGDALAFVSDRSGAFELYVRDLAGGGIDAPLTHDGGQNVQPAWSPDGRLLAYHSSRHGGVWVIPARGGAARQIAAVGSNPAWAPDGRRLAFQSDEFTDVTPSAFGAQSGSTLWIVNVDGTDLRALTAPGQPPGGHALPAWTRDGRRVAFMVFDGADSNGIWLLDVASGRTRLLDAGRGLYEFAFAPDGSAIYAAGGTARILRLPFDQATGTTTGARTAIPVPGVPGVRGLTISADGGVLAFSGLSLTSQIWAQPITRDGARRGDARPLTTDTSRRNSLATVSPDGSRVAYMSSRQGAPPSVWVMNADGSDRRSLTPDESADGEPAWFPDGRRVAYRSNRGGADGLWIVDVVTRRETPWLDVQAARLAASTAGPPGGLGEWRMAPTMAAAAFSLRLPPFDRRALFVTALDAPAPRALTDGSASVGYPAWSPDGRSLAVEVKDGSTMHAGVVDVASGRLRLVTRERGQTWVRSWSPDGARVAAAALREGTWDLRWIDAATGVQGTITPSAGPRVYMRYPEWSPRGDLVVFERGELLGNIWTMALRHTS